MGNRCFITTEDKGIGVYLHWNGGRDTIEPLLRYCELHGYRSPEKSGYGWACLCKVMGNFFGGTNSVGIDVYDNYKDGWLDNGVYIVKDWNIVGREYFDGCHEQTEYDFDEMLQVFDERMPEHDRLGEYLDSVETATESLRVGDKVYMRNCSDKFIPFTVIGFTEDGIPYVNMYDHDGDYSWNPNNHIKGKTCRIVPKRRW